MGRSEAILPGDYHLFTEHQGSAQTCLGSMSCSPWRKPSASSCICRDKSGTFLAEPTSPRRRSHRAGRWVGGLPCPLHCFGDEVPPLLSTSSVSPLVAVWSLWEPRPAAWPCPWCSGRAGTPRAQLPRDPWGNGRSKGDAADARGHRWGSASPGDDAGPW